MNPLKGIAASALSGGSSNYVYATLVDYDPFTALSTVELLGEEISGVPKLQHVAFGGYWEPISAGFIGTSGEGHVIDDIPDYDAYDLDIYGRADSAQNINYRINGSDTGYRSTNVFITTSLSRAYNDTAMYCGRWSTNSTLSRIRISKTLNNTPNYFWSSFATSAISNAGDGTNATVISSGLWGTASTPITDLTFYAGGVGGNVFTDFGWRLWGQRPFSIAAGTQVLCIRDNLVPLTIIGVLQGATV